VIFVQVFDDKSG